MSDLGKVERWFSGGGVRGLALALVALLWTGAVAAESNWPPAEPDRREAEASASGQSKTSASSQKSGSGKADGASKGGSSKGSETGGDAGKTGKAAAKEEKPLRPDLKPGKAPWQWRILKAAWSAEDEQGFEEFIRQIGESDCTTVHDCLTSPTANPHFSGKHPPRMQFFADCADLPFILRGYYAWQAGLPFSFSVRLDSHPRTGGHRSRLYGTQVVDRYDIVGPGPDPRLALPAIYQFVSSEHFRNPPNYAGKMLADHYPVAISRTSVRPGTVIFDPDGHLAVIYKVTEDGRVFYIDAHPDNSLTRGMFNREFARAEPPMGAGFKRWRPQRLEGARTERDGTLTGGKIVLARNSELADWSDEQFFGNQEPRPADWKDSRFVVDGQTVDYHDYVRVRLAYPGFKYEPLGETRTMLRQICRDLNYRVEAVNLAVRTGLDRRPQPDKLPQNIYATKGDWEIYSTPSRDARLKTAIEELRDELARFLKLFKDGSLILDYDGQDLRRDLLTVYRAESAACSIAYGRSDGTAVTIGFEEAKRRLFNLSFDPHHCVERRWGADDPAELATCRDDRLKTDWYLAEARLRNQLVRTYGEKMGWRLAELQDPNLDIGIAEAPDVDPLKVLENADFVVAAKVETGVAGGDRARGGRGRQR